MSAKRAISRGLLKLVKWAGVTLAREGVELIVDKTTQKQPDDTLHISPSPEPSRIHRGAVVVDGRFRERMLSHPEELQAEVARILKAEGR